MPLSLARPTALAVLLLVSTSLASPLSAATHLVPKKHATLQAAVAAAAPGDTIVVTSGIYEGPVIIPSTKVGLRIVAKGKVWVENDPTPVSWTNGGAVVRIHADGVTLEGLGVRHGSGNPADPVDGAVHVAADGVTLKKLRLHRANGPAVRVTGDGVRVLDCEVRGCRYGVLVVGDDARIADCDVRMIQQDGISIDGKDATVRDCRVVRARKVGIRVKGGGAAVRKNEVDAAGEGGILVDGSLPDVFENEVRMTGGAAPSIEVKLDGDHTITAVSRIRKNRCFDGDGAGIRMSGEAAGRIEGNTVVRCGAGSAFSGATAAGIQSFGKDVVDNRVEECPGDGIRVQGTATLVEGNRLVGNLEDGLEITGGTNVVVRDNVARSNHGEGFENGGVGTVFVGNVAKKNRIDVASTGTFGAYADNEIKTGGPDQDPEVD